MPLLDHFHPPIHPVHHWDAFHSNWATRIADRLNDHWLPPEFLAQETTHSGGQLEIDIATYEQAEAGAAEGASVSLATKRTVYTPPPTVATLDAIIPDVYEVRVYSDTGGATLIGAIELVSPANKDRAASRDAFTTKCVALLHQGVSVVVVDIVTSRHANLHHNIMRSLGAGPPPRNVEHLYAAAYRPVQREGKAFIDVWHEACGLGAELPTMPLRLTGDLFVPVELEAAYQEACRRRRLI